jgi:hypothetical protein
MNDAPRAASLCRRALLQPSRPDAGAAAERSPEVLPWLRTVHPDPPTWAELASIADARQATLD